MKNIEELCLELKNAFIFEVKDNTNWDVAEFPMEFREGMSAGGLFILKKNEQETGRISIEKFTQVFSILRKLIDPTKINRGTLTIYPDGTYESEFIWDEEADRQYRFTSVWQAIHYLGHDFFHHYLQTNFPEWTFALVNIHINTSIKAVLNIDTKTEQKEVLVDLPPEIQEGLRRMHHQTNEGDFKGMIEAWNILELRMDKVKGFDFDQDASFKMK